MSDSSKAINYLIEENRRYREALNKIANEKTMSHYLSINNMAEDFKCIAKKALESEVH